MTLWIVLILLLWFAWAVLVRWIVGVRPRGDDGYASAVVRLFQVYARRWQRTTYEGLGHIPGADAGGSPDEPLIVVCNHTAGIDPVLVQAACPFEVRWMMALDMRVRFMEGIWKYGRILFVDRENPTGMELREAMAHVKGGGVLGVFPEGGIARPSGSPGELLPFREGVGLMVRRTGALVLPVAITGTPVSPSAWGSIWRRSRNGARVRFLETTRFGRETDAKAITAALEETIASALRSMR
ncbi:MAG: 1-acyl-sn-glycerol-3-phosphate acyltransferase [Phycisphaerales bacterium]|nr:1-acyl-sn-glycerol-3-phosphate acyltransferase [Phycisphaerales bacterium]